MEPMLSAISDSGIPKGDGWEYEPKWDGFRTLVFQDVGRNLRAGQAALGEDQAQAHRGLCGHRMAEVERRVGAWCSPARPVRQKGHHPLRRPHLLLQRGGA